MSVKVESDGEDGYSELDEVTEIEIEPRCEHTIDIDNIYDDEIVTHSILLIRGTIKPMCGQKKSIYIQQLESSVALKIAVVQLSVRGEFRVLIDSSNYDDPRIERNINIHFKIKYCDSERTVSFIYKPHECIYRVQPLYIICHKDDESQDKENEESNSQSVIAQAVDIEAIRAKNLMENKILKERLASKHQIYKVNKNYNMQKNLLKNFQDEDLSDMTEDDDDDDISLDTSSDEDGNASGFTPENYEDVLITDNAIDIINLNLRLVQGIYADVLRNTGANRRTFKINGPCKLFYSDLSCKDAWQMTEEELWQYFAKELLNSQYGYDNKVKFVAFIGCTKYEGRDLFKSNDFSYANIRRHLKAHAALGSGGLALFGTGHFYSWPRYFGDIISCFSNDNKINQAIEPDESNYRRTYGGVYASTLGALCHEMGHIFDLGHTINGIMGSGLDYVNRLFTVDNLTEVLPNRVIAKGVLEAPPKPHEGEDIYRPSFTQIKKGENIFLEKYRQQNNRVQNLFYFTHSCQVILTYHPWFSTLVSKYQYALAEGGAGISFNRKTCTVTTDEPHSLKIIEIRCNLNSLVKEFFEFRNTNAEPAVFRVTLPPTIHHLVVLSKTHHIFAITTTGHMKKMY